MNSTHKKNPFWLKTNTRVVSINQPSEEEPSPIKNSFTAQEPHTFHRQNSQIDEFQPIHSRTLHSPFKAIHYTSPDPEIHPSIYPDPEPRSKPHPNPNLTTKAYPEPQAISPKISENMLEIMDMLGNQDFDHKDCRNQGRIVRRLENIKEALKKIKLGRDEPKIKNDPNSIKKEKRNSMLKEKESNNNFEKPSNNLESVKLENEKLRKNNMELKQLLSKAQFKNQSEGKIFMLKIKIEKIWE